MDKANDSEITNGVSKNELQMMCQGEWLSDNVISVFTSRWMHGRGN